MFLKPSYNVYIHPRLLAQLIELDTELLESVQF